MLGIAALYAPVASAQIVDTQANLSSTSTASQIAQVPVREAPTPNLIPTDVTPYALGDERQLLSPTVRFRMFQKLPARLWFNSTTEVSQRLDTNVLFTKDHYLADYAFRVLPNISLGYDVFKNTSVYCNWFLIKDVFARYGSLLNFPTTQSLSLGFRQNIPVTRKFMLQLDFQSRELWQTKHLQQADLLPAINATYVVNPNFITFGSALLQMRGKNYFVAPTRELDPFFTVGALARRGQWNFVATNTYVMNFRDPPFNGSIPRQGNFSMISDFEVNRPVSKKVPNLVAFVRAEPIWNWNSKGVPGLSGFDFRLFGGLRLSLNKPSYGAQMQQFRQQLIDSEEDSTPTPLKGKKQS